MGASPQMVDWDEDGDVDLIVGEYDGHIHYFQNIGTATNPVLTNRGHLMVGSSQIDVSTLAIPVVNDWNEDGRKDLVVGNNDANIKLFINTGTNENPSFSSTQTITCSPNITQIKNAPDIGDLNGDGLKDLAFGWWQGTVVYYPNSGTNASPVFDSQYELTALGTTIDPGGWTHLEMNDWDEDGDLDLIYGEWEGEVYVHLNITNEFECSLTPIGGPIQIPANGGTFDCTGQLINHYSQPVSWDTWIVALLPTGFESPVLAQATKTIGAGGQIDGDKTQNVPANAPAGDYQYILRWGSYPYQVWAEDSFPFTKAGSIGDATDLSGWYSDGNLFNDPPAVEGDIPAVFEICSPYPNPFNPETVFEFALPEVSSVQLDVYDLQGKRVAELISGTLPAGKHTATLNAVNLASGVYVYRLTAGGNGTSGKIVLMK